MASLADTMKALGAVLNLPVGGAAPARTSQVVPARVVQDPPPAVGKNLKVAAPIGVPAPVPAPGIMAQMFPDVARTHSELTGEINTNLAAGNYAGAAGVGLRGAVRYPMALANDVVMHPDQVLNDAAMPAVSKLFQGAIGYTPSETDANTTRVAAKAAPVTGKAAVDQALKQGAAQKSPSMDAQDALAGVIQKVLAGGKAPVSVITDLAGALPAATKQRQTEKDAGYGLTSTLSATIYKQALEQAQLDEPTDIAARTKLIDKYTNDYFLRMAALQTNKDQPVALPDPNE